MNRQSDPSPVHDKPDLTWPDAVYGQRLELAVMRYVGGFSVLAIAGYTVYRLLIGDWISALVNAAILLLLIAALLLVRVKRYQPVAMPLFGLIITASCVASSLIIGSNGLLWAFLVFWVNLLLLSHGTAIVLNGVAILVLASQARLYETTLEQLSWVTVALLINAFGLYFARQLREQRRMLRQLASHDPLTGIGNRRLMQHHLEQAIVEARRHDQRFAVVVLDLDRFKRLNDRHGHKAGDDALRRFACRIEKALRTEDRLFRMGGEEFVLLLRDIGEDTARTTLPELHERLSGLVRGPDEPIRFSAGAACLKKGEDWSRWLGRADRALYQAKRSGRDNLVIAD